ncbi:MAG: hypothetical protein ABJB12_02070 [Pseudomonadota bacterium]
MKLAYPNAVLLLVLSLFSACTDEQASDAGAGETSPGAAGENGLGAGGDPAAEASAGQGQAGSTPERSSDAGASSGGAAGDAGAGAVIEAGAAGASMGAAGAAAAGGGGADPGNGHVLVKQLAGGWGFSCALTQAGGVRCWGDGSYGALGDGTPLVDSELLHTATNVAGLTQGVKKIAAGGWNVCAIKSDDTVVCWGLNAYHALAIDSASHGSSSPVALNGFTAAALDVTVAFDYSGTTSHGCVVDSASKVLCWGDNSSYQLGVTTPATSSALIPVTGLSGFKAVTAGESFTCGLTSAGGVNCWGSDVQAQLGDGLGSRLTPPTALPVQVVGLTSGVKQVVANVRTACAVTTAGGVKCWGAGSAGQLGSNVALDPDPGGVTTPADVSGLSSGVVQLAGAYRHYCALLQDHTVRCWGYNQNGQLGDQPATITINQFESIPLEVVGVSNAVAVGTGLSQSCAALATGGVQCWGSGYASGSLKSTNQIVPTFVNGL